MARRVLQKDQIVKLIVGAGQASPSPPVGPALGSKGVKSMDFCKVWTANASKQQELRSNLLIGVQRKNSKLRPRHTNPSASHSPPRSILQLRASNTTNSIPSSVRSRSSSNKEQAERCRKHCWTAFQSGLGG